MDGGVMGIDDGMMSIHHPIISSSLSTVITTFPQHIPNPLTILFATIKAWIPVFDCRYDEERTT
jgi:hypothetical protein